MNEERLRRRQRAPRPGKAPTHFAPLPPAGRESLSAARYPDRGMRSPASRCGIHGARGDGPRISLARALILLKKNNALVDDETQMVRMGRDLVSLFVALAPARFRCCRATATATPSWAATGSTSTRSGPPPQCFPISTRAKAGFLRSAVRSREAQPCARRPPHRRRCRGRAHGLRCPPRHLDNAYALLRYSDRPVMVRAVSRFRAEDAIAMVAIARGKTLG